MSPATNAGRACPSRCAPTTATARPPTRRRWCGCASRVAAMAAAGVVGTLVAQIEDELEAVVERICDDIPDFRRLPKATLAEAVRGNVSRALAALRELRDPTPEELERAAAV